MIKSFRSKTPADDGVGMVFYGVELAVPVKGASKWHVAYFIPQGAAYTVKLWDNFENYFNGTAPKYIAKYRVVLEEVTCSM